MRGGTSRRREASPLKLSCAEMLLECSRLVAVVWKDADRPQGTS